MRCKHPVRFCNPGFLVRFHGGPLESQVYEADVHPEYVYYREPIDVEEELDVYGADLPRRMTYRPIHRYDRFPAAPGAPAAYLWTGQQEQVEVVEPFDEVLHLPEHRGHPCPWT